MHRQATRDWRIVPNLTFSPDTMAQEIKFQFVELMTGVTFLFPNKKVTKEIGIGEALRAKAPSPMYPTRRNDYRPLKMS